MTEDCMTKHAKEALQFREKSLCSCRGTVTVAVLINLYILYGAGVGNYGVLQRRKLGLAMQ